MLKWVLAVGMAAAVPAVALAQDVENGKAVFKKCVACHQFGKNLVGPDLKGVVGRKAGEAAGFNYSPAMKNSGVVWDEASLSEYLADPKKKIPGNKMIFPGIKDEAERKDVIAYIASQK